MAHRRLIELVVLGLWIAIAAVVSVNHDWNHSLSPVKPNQAESGKNYDVRKVTVVRGDSFDLTIKDGNDSRILAKLSVFATEDANKKVLNLLNHSTNPRVVLHEKQSDGRWKIDFFFTNDGKEINLAEWLIENKLVYK